MLTMNGKPVTKGDLAAAYAAVAPTQTPGRNARPTRERRARRPRSQGRKHKGGVR